MQYYIYSILNIIHRYMNYIFAGSSIVIKSLDFVMTYIDTVVKAPRL